MCYLPSYLPLIHAFPFPLWGSECSQLPLQKPSPVLGPVRPHFFVLHAEIGRALQVNQLCLFNRPDINILWHEVFACAHGPVNNLGG